ncbi:hypothetical protein ASPFODRAFT_32613 [Aspergillus luchuensis CBS 106.47]|uniref:Uncharacterized protein n=1 Tax=Aspergillus luchuensis (strain CBS 106.47) TaxID=1137211 RepID=A0A1M3TI46_ASPLC|nr:hypothetical protein ASPFODRAFT_32613 [Aspergillus luchuensis CBS 106.47]
MSDRDVKDERLCYNGMGFMIRSSGPNVDDFSQRDREIALLGFMKKVQEHRGRRHKAMVDVIRAFDPNVQAGNLGICLKCFHPNESLRRRIESDNVAVSIIDFTKLWHAPRFEPTAIYLAASSFAKNIVATEPLDASPSAIQLKRIRCRLLADGCRKKEQSKKHVPGKIGRTKRWVGKSDTTRSLA